MSEEQFEEVELEIEDEIYDRIVKHLGTEDTDIIGKWISELDNYVKSEYEKISINPNGDKNKIERGEILAISGIKVTIAAKAYPVDQDENSPQKIPNPGINIGNAIVVLCTKIPNASISKTNFSNSSMNKAASSSLTVDIEPSWKIPVKIPKNTKNVIILILFILPWFNEQYLRVSLEQI